MAVKVIQKFVRSCSECPHFQYYSGGMYECDLTDERMKKDEAEERIADKCPLPWAGDFQKARP